MWSHNNNVPARGFTTPPPTWKSRASCSPAAPESEKKRLSANKEGLFHVVHKVPAGDSPYVRAKQVQLIDKDPHRAISLFWSAINSGDRVDSALKDMAVVMKQLNRSDEAIEAIKSFRHLCPHESQESLDNVLVELYKRSGRLDEQIEMLQYKLKNIEDGIAFGGKRTKIARSQGKKIQITIEQEKSRLLGNLAWAYLQQNNYETAGDLYRQALALDPDKNKECNLAICLMHMNKITEAKAMLYKVRVSTQNGKMDDSYARSFERASQILTELEGQSVINSKEREGCEEMRRHIRSPVARNSTEVNGYINEGKDSGFESAAGGSYFQSQFENKGNYSLFEESSDCIYLGLSSSQSSPQVPYVDKWKNGAQFRNSLESSDFCSERKGNWISTVENVGSAHQRTYSSPVPVQGNPKVPSTEQRRGPHLFSNEDQRKGTWGENTMDSTGRKLLFGKPIANEAWPAAPKNLTGISSDEKLNSKLRTPEKSVQSPTTGDWGAWGGITRVKSVTAMEPISDSTFRGHCKWIPSNGTERLQLKNETVMEYGLPHVDGGQERNYWGNVEQKKFPMKEISLSPSTHSKSPIAVNKAANINDRQNAAHRDKKRNFRGNVEPNKFPMKQNNLSSGMQLKSSPAASDDGRQPVPAGEGKSYYGERSESSPSMQLATPTNPGATFTNEGCWEQGSDIPITGNRWLTSSFDEKRFGKNSGKQMSLQGHVGNPESTQDFSTSRNRKSWADMVEEEEEELLRGGTEFLESNLDYPSQKPPFPFQTPNKWSADWSNEEDFNDENRNSNIFHRTPYSLHQMDNLSHKLQAFDLKDEYSTPGSEVSSRNNPTARRSLCFDQQQKPDPGEHSCQSPLPKKTFNFEGSKFAPANEGMPNSGNTIKLKRRNRLQVFREITLHPESPQNMN